jgi:hypothetical protein
MELPAEDSEYLDERGLRYTVFEEGAMLCVRLHDFPLPPGLSHSEVDILFRLPAGYPIAQPDMWWCLPAITRADGSTIQATEHNEIYAGLTWQRWSRHLNPGAWAPGIDGLEAFMTLLRVELQKASGALVA